MADAPRRRSAFSKQPDAGTGGQGNSGPAAGGYCAGDALEPGSPLPGGQIRDGNVYIPPPADTSTMPENIKVDLTTPLEFLWVVVGIIALFAAFYLYSEGSYGHYSKHSRTHFPPQPHLLAYVPYAIFAAFASLVGWLLTDNYYIINTRLRKIFYHFKFFGVTSVTEYLDSSRILAVGVTGVKKHSKHRTWWEYRIVVVDDRGRFTDFSNSCREEGRWELNDKARGMASVLGCQFADCPPEVSLRAHVENGSAQWVYFDGGTSFFPSFSQRGPDDVHPLVAFGAIAATLIIIFVVAYMTSR